MTKPTAGFDSSGLVSARGADFGQAGERPKKGISQPGHARTFSALPTGPRAFANRTNPMLATGPGTAPPGFVTASTSGSEWYVYWALAKISGDPHGDDVRKPPFYGSRDESIWKYQYPYAGGRHLPGGAVVDFVWQPFNNPLLIRLQTEHFHVFSTTIKQATDLLQKDRLSDFGKVVDLFDQWFISDPSGAAVIVQCKRAIRGLLPIDPLLTGTSTRVHVPTPGGKHG